MKTGPLIEGLLYRVPNIAIPLRTLGIMKPYRKFSSSEHPELDYILKYFNENVSFVGVYSSKQTIAIYSGYSVDAYGKMPTIYIKGEVAEFVEKESSFLSKRYMSQEINRIDYIPEGQKRIILIDHFDEESSYGEMYSQWIDRQWVKGTGLDLYNSEPFPFRMEYAFNDFYYDLYNNAKEERKVRLEKEKEEYLRLKREKYE